ncbi:hypothetical protein [Flavobacterium agrisoli]|uniref:Uncharacterized protein n=1 Tax=Flavobacterium agrisoli TaxID=2793066 RepID=A0A934PL02_9FLAO|nr:hypothetical protein [Flavobacterium agrisoli]MBK0368690.1 hypothetical protein [Flavobacterium agrisoli]
MLKEVHSTTTISKSLTEVFDYFFSLNPLGILQEFGYLAQNKTEILVNTNSMLGSEELIYFHDGSTALYQLYDLMPNVLFSIHIDDFSSKRIKGLEAIRCHYSFDALESGMVIVHCCIS